MGSLPVTVERILSGGSSGGGGGGGGSSGENYTNIEVIEKYDLQISKDVLTSYRFTHVNNPIMYVDITGNTSFGIITTSAEVLKNTSTLVKVTPEGLVYRNVNIWVGTSGFATPRNIKKALIKFRVEDSWISGNNIKSSSIRMVRWDGSKWEKLETSVENEDVKYTYFSAKTNAFSSFAITSLEEKISSSIPQTVAQYRVPETVKETTPGAEKHIGASPANSYIMITVFGIIGIVMVVYLIKREKIKK